MYGWNDSRIVTNIQKDDSNDNKKVVLTFDDGPTEYLEAILNTLSAHGVRAVFFWLTSNLTDTELIKKVEEDGHVIGLHGNDHVDFRKLTKLEQQTEIQEGVCKLQKFACEPVDWFRPPYGQYDSNLLNVLKDNDLRPLLWEVASLDWECEQHPEQIVKNVIDNIRDGAVILLHELPQTVAVLGSLIEHIIQKGYEITLPDV
ncbi:polysaccharide deacetylase family protein [Alkalihalobacillus sp. AL-G]|uniref:polysaccharide deacetylase family protein n=1 Tax=Alkalihalobacillus sp. AL-G TaxID=2926399 RepID=UPI002729CE93|nr:polysaccharide deacetylase family protein [Alkalihalobacillus sp. AL-G]WLD94042.1 polysaccharide deacetylase family protein [Alkalihalobacillus sp. AL-G]